MTTARQPSLYLTHGGGPCFFMEWDPPETWDGLRAALESVPALLPGPPRAIVCVTGHWEADPVAVETAERPPLVYDYSGFPPHTYELTYPAPGSPELAARVVGLLDRAGVPARGAERGWDHGVFVPLKVAFPDADVPLVAVSLRADLDPGTHLRMGQALAPLRDDGVLIVGSGSSYHNLRAWGPTGTDAGIAFEAWLQDVLPRSGADRAEALTGWLDAPSARIAHPREEHLIPLMVAAGAAGDEPGRAFFSGAALGPPLSCWVFGDSAGATH